jgi:putative aldouronate transport system substrate-binding protein
MKTIMKAAVAVAMILSVPSLWANGQAQAGPQAAGKPYQIQWYVIGNGTPADIAKVEAEASRYIQGKGLNAELKLTTFDWGSYDTKMQTIIASGEPFDICFTAVWTNHYRTNAVRGAFLPLNDPADNLFAKFMPKTLATIGPDFLAGSAIDGVNYAVPANKEKAHNWGLILRKDLVAKYKMDVAKIKTMADLEPFLQTIKEKEPGMYPLEATDGESPRLALDWDTIVDDKVPVALPSKPGAKKIVFWLETPEAKAYFDLMRKYYLAGYIRKDAAAITDFNADEKAGLIFAAVKSMKPGKADEMTNQTGQPWMQIDLTVPVMSNRETTGSLQAISRTSKNPEMAARFLELFNTDPYLNNLINFGVEGTHYLKVGPQVIKAGPAADKYSPSTGWMFGNQFINYLMDNEDPAKWDLFIKYNASAVPLTSLGFSYDSAGVQNEVAACKNVWAEFVPGLETGTLDPAVALPQAIEKFKASGVMAIVADAQKQYDAWLKKTGR